MRVVNDAAKRARWSVRWPHDGRIVRKDFGTDFGAAVKLLAKALEGGRMATLVCNNMGFPPPDDYQPHKVQGYKRNSRGKRVYVEGYVVPMKKLNAKGVWWCPYCAKFRKFELNKGFRVSGVFVPEPSYNCPLCNISHKDGNVRRWNPVAVKLYNNPPWKRTRAGNGKPTNRRR